MKFVFTIYDPLFLNCKSASSTYYPCVCQDWTTMSKRNLKWRIQKCNKVEDQKNMEYSGCWNPMLNPMWQHIQNLILDLDQEHMLSLAHSVQRYQSNCKFIHCKIRKHKSLELHLGQKNTCIFNSWLIWNHTHISIFSITFPNTVNLCFFAFFFHSLLNAWKKLEAFCMETWKGFVCPVLVEVSDSRSTAKLWFLK